MLYTEVKNKQSFISQTGVCRSPFDDLIQSTKQVDVIQEHMAAADIHGFYSENRNTIEKLMQTFTSSEKWPIHGFRGICRRIPSPAPLPLCKRILREREIPTVCQT
jgi:hypothetical protein